MKKAPRQPSPHRFGQIPRADIPRSSFDLSHGLKTTFDADLLIPIGVWDTIPGDSWNVKSTVLARLATPLKPLMDNIYIDVFYFWTPYRILWENWEKFCGEQDNPGDSTDYLIPTTSGTVTTNSLYDYFGVPISVSLTFNNLAGRAYNLIYNEWFRDENLQNSVTVDKDDGPDTLSDYTLLKRGKRHDYFTSALPWPQKGDAVQLPLGTSAPINVDVLDKAVSVYNPGVSGLRDLKQLTWVVADGTGTTNDNPMYADLSDATAATINQLREAFQIQRLYEKDARGGTRYTEVIQSHFGVTSPDARLQRPEYLGGGKDRINVNPIPQTSSTDSTTPQGNMSGFATTGFNGHRFSKSFTEHSVVLGMAVVFADLNYQQGLPRHFSRQTRWDFYWPTLAHLGEQTILNKEIYAQGDSNDNNVFGYQERFAEYRYKPSMITGQMRSGATGGSLDNWHLAQDFGSLPALNASFIEENPPVNRVSAVPSEPDLLLDLFFRLRCARPMPTYSVPGLIDHF
jgi:hypothetical protein